MNCRRARKALLEYSDGTLAAARRGEIDDHIASCEECRAAVERITLSGAALSTLEPVRMPEAAAARVRAGIRATSPAKGGRLSSVMEFLERPAVLATTGAVAMILIAVAVVVGVTVGGPSKRKDSRLATSFESSGAAKTTPALSAPAEEAGELLPGLASVGLPTPVVKVSDTDYDPQSLQAMLEEMPARREYATSYDMSDAVQMRGDYTDKAALEFQELGGDGAMYEAMVGFITSSEPVMLPCYLEKALFSGQGVYIIGLAAPSRSGETTRLDRIEVWVMNPDLFLQGPNSSIVYFMEQRITE